MGALLCSKGTTLCSLPDAGDADSEMSLESQTQILSKGIKMPRMQYLAGFKEEKWASYPTCPMLASTGQPAFSGTIDDVAKSYPELAPVLYNDVKICAKCGKPCAFTLSVCNSCGASLQDVPITKSENVFSAFLLGVAKASKGFPYTISLRGISSDVLVTDDLLALSPIHLNAIPKKYYIPDWRFLLTSPKDALSLLDTMENELWQVTSKFLSDKELRGSIFKPGVTDAEIREMVICSFNFPPSQFQLHIQWIVPPLLPFQHLMAEQRNHFHEGRAFPMSYVRKILALNEPYKVTKDTPVDDIVKHYELLGVSYRTEWQAFYESALYSTMRVQNWSTEDFQYVVQDGKAFEFTIMRDCIVPDATPADVDPKKLQEKDKAALQNYGRPYNNGKPSGKYIPSPLEPKLGKGGFGEWPGVFKSQ